MSLKRKHRLILDVTVSKAMTRRDVAKAIQRLFDERLDLAARPLFVYDNAPYCDKLVVLERAGRVPI